MCSSDLFPQDQIVGNDLAVALPPVAFRAHDGARALRGGEGECVQGIEKRFRLRIMRVTPEERVSPRNVAGARRRDRITQSAQILEMPIADPLLPQIGGEAVAVELRIAPRERNPPHVHNLVHAPSLEQAEELLGRVSGMTYRIEAGAHFCFTRTEFAQADRVALKRGRSPHSKLFDRSPARSQGRLMSSLPGYSWLLGLPRDLAHAG